MVHREPLLFGGVMVYFERFACLQFYRQLWGPLCPTIYRSTPSLHGYGEALQRWMMLEMDATYLSIECGPKGPPYLYLGPRPQGKGKLAPAIGN